MPDALDGPTHSEGYTPAGGDFAALNAAIEKGTIPQSDVDAAAAAITAAIKAEKSANQIISIVTSVLGGLAGKLLAVAFACLLLAGCAHHHDATVDADVEADLSTSGKDGKIVHAKGVIPKGSLVEFPPKAAPCSGGKCPVKENP